MRHIKVPVPPLSEQQRLVAAIEQLEQTIAAAPSKKQAIMRAYLS
jgi:restriction endonuclease S subunit